MADVQTKMKGRGGTSFIPVIRYINGEKEYSDVKKYPMAGKYRDALLVYFTDGYGDYEIPKPKTYRNLWVVLHDVKNLSLKNPYGDVKSLSMDADYKKLKGIRWLCLFWRVKLLAYFERIKAALESRGNLSQEEITSDIKAAEKNFNAIEFEMQNLFNRRGIL